MSAKSGRVQLKGNRMNTGTKIGLASAFGAFAGGVVAWYAHHAWWAVLLGLLVGALAGYLSYEWKAVQQTTVRILKTEIRIPRPNKNAVLFSLGAGIVVGGWFAWGITVFCGLYELVESTARTRTFLSFVCPIAFTLAFLLTFAMTFRGTGVTNPNDVIEMWEIVKTLNPIALPFTLAFFGIRGVWTYRKKIAATLVRFAKWTARVTRKIFIAIHCEERVQSAFYAAVGVLVGHFASHAFIGVLIGAVVGFVLGSVSYKLISVRFLKPARA